VTHSEITVTRTSEDLAEIVTVAGEIDIATYGQLRTMLITAVDAGFRGADAVLEVELLGAREVLGAASSGHGKRQGPRARRGGAPAPPPGIRAASRTMTNGRTYYYYRR
jgi:hypothetical protein